MKKIEIEKKIEIDWVDSMARTGWHPMAGYDEYAEEPTSMLHHTVGYLLKDLEDRYVVTQSYGVGTGMVDAVMEIPKVAVVKIKTWK